MWLNECGKWMQASSVIMSAQQFMGCFRTIRCCCCCPCLHTHSSSQLFRQPDQSARSCQFNNHTYASCDHPRVITVPSHIAHLLLDVMLCDDAVASYCCACVPIRPHSIYPVVLSNHLQRSVTVIVVHPSYPSPLHHLYSASTLGHSFHSAQTTLPKPCYFSYLQRQRDTPSLLLRTY